MSMSAVQVEALRRVVKAGRGWHRAHALGIVEGTVGALERHGLVETRLDHWERWEIRLTRAGREAAAATGVSG